MAFIDELKKLVIENGQLKVTNKDKAIVEIAQEVVKLPKMTKIISIWEKDDDVYTRLQSVTPEGTKPQVFNFIPTGTKRLCYLCNDENEPKNDDSNVIAIIDAIQYQIITNIRMKLISFSQTTQFDSQNDKLKGFLNFWDETETQLENPDFFVNVNQ